MACCPSVCRSPAPGKIVDIIALVLFKILLCIKNPMFVFLHVYEMSIVVEFFKYKFCNNGYRLESEFRLSIRFSVCL